MEHKDKIYIIGAGVSGLIAAYELEQAGYHPIIIEQTDEVGGRVKTIHEKGYALDLGFQVLLSAYPLAKKYLDMEQLQLCKLESGALIYANNKSYLIGDPLRNWKILIPTLMSDIGSIADKLKILKLNIQLKFKSLEKIFASPEKTTPSSAEMMRRFCSLAFCAAIMNIDQPKHRYPPPIAMRQICFSLREFCVVVALGLLTKLHNKNGLTLIIHSVTFKSIIKFGKPTKAIIFESKIFSK